MCLFLDEACSWTEKVFTDINSPPLVSDEDTNFGGSLEMISSLAAWKYW